MIKLRFKRKCLRALICAFLAAFFLSVPIVDLRAKPPEKSTNWGPWIQKKVHKKKSKRSLAGHLFHIYHKHLSSKDGASCPFYPTCSAYSFQALTQHGYLYGSLLTLNRLLSEYPGMPKSGHYPLITVYGLHRPYDPVP